MINMIMEGVIMSVLCYSHKYEPFTNEEFKQMPSADGISSSIISHYLLGDVSAKNEWSVKPDIARDTFIHLTAYEHFIEAEQLLLLGRTGSGKSAIMYRLEDDILNKQVTNYSDVIRIDENIFCEKLAKLCYDIDVDRFDATNTITRAVVMTIYTQVMLYCFQKFPEEKSKLKKTIKYLWSKGFIRIKDKSLLEHLEHLTSEDFMNQIGTFQNNKNIKPIKDVAKVLAVVGKIINCDEDSVIDENEDYNEAIEEVGEFLSEKNKKILVLLDSFDEYKINDKAFVVAIRSLILACFEIYSNHIKYKVYFKMAIASEVYTRILTHLPAKNHTNTVAIIWSFKDLMRCMALRFVSWYHDPNAKHKDKRDLFSFLEKYNVSDLKKNKSSFDVTQEIFYHILPQICKTNSNYTYLTLAFISRHTMKKPREILQIFNAILDRIIYEEDNQYFLNDNNNFKIKDVVHSLQNDFIKQNLSLYRNFIPNIHDYIYNLLCGRRFIFSISDGDFENKLKEVNAKVQNDTKGNEYLRYFDKFDVLNIVFETGLLGRVSEVRTVDAKNIEQFGTDVPIKIIDALFEYQFKGKIQKSKEIQYVIHPMCYEHFNCYVGLRSMVNTDSYDTTEILASILADE